MRGWQGLGLIGLAACGFISNTEYDTRIDADGDGLLPQELTSGDDYDCDDSRARIGLPSLWFNDGDGDGFGDAELSVLACEAPDGYVDEDDDCDDSDASIHEEAAEFCDGVDNNCNGEIDESSTFVDYYPDVDGDLQGDASASPLNVCAPPDGYVTDNLDCDDNDPLEFEGQEWHEDGDGDGFGKPLVIVSCERISPSDVTDGTDCNDMLDTVFPGAPIEYCDGANNDCSPGPVATEELDQDGDGYVVCDPAGAPWAGLVPKLGGDCDDNEAAANPGVLFERCDGIDNLCLGAVSADEIDTDGDGFVACEDWVGNPGLFLDGGDCEEGNNARYPGAQVVCNDGVINDCDAERECGVFGFENTSEALTTLSGDAPGTRLGTSIATIRWGPGPCAALALGAPTDGLGAPHVFVFRGDAAASDNACSVGGWRDSVRTTAPMSVDYVLEGGSTERVGQAVATVGDVDGGGVDDLLISASGTAPGAAYLVSGEDVTTGPPYLLSPVDHPSGVTEFSGGLNNGTAGAVVSAALQWNPGVGICPTCKDVLIGDPEYQDASEQGGAAYLILGDGNAGGTYGLDALDLSENVVFTGQISGDRVGSSLTGGLDFTGDGVSDLVIGADGENRFLGGSDGGVYILPGPISGGAYSLTTQFSSLPLNGARLGGDVGGRLGPALLVPELVVTGSAAADLVLGAPGTQSDTGAAYILLGGGLPASGPVVDVVEIELLGTSPGDLFGAAFASGDLDADGLFDLVVMAPGAPAGAGDGWVYLFSGVDLQTAGGVLLAADATQIIKGSGGELATSVQIDDLDADGMDDLVVGAPLNSGGLGKVYVFFGDGE